MPNLIFYFYDYRSLISFSLWYMNIIKSLVKSLDRRITGLYNPTPIGEDQELITST